MPSEGLGGRCTGMTAVPPSCPDCLEILGEPQTPGALGACWGLYRDSFTRLYFFLLIVADTACMELVIVIERCMLCGRLFVSTHTNIQAHYHTVVMV